MSPILISTGSKYYCRPCAERENLLKDLPPASTSPSDYQIKKAAKHSGPVSTSTGINSVLDSGSTVVHAQLMDITRRQGFVEVERNGCLSIVYKSTGYRYIGTRFDASAPILSLDSFRVVLSTAPFRTHGYPVSSTQYNGVECSGALAYCTFNGISAPLVWALGSFSQRSLASRIHTEDNLLFIGLINP